jgi:hypothetical protein
MKSLDLARIRNCAKNGTGWDLGNQVLYDLCEKYPGHANIDEIVAKIWIIGRTYAAAIERRSKAKDLKGDDFYLRAVGPIIRNARIERWLEPLGAQNEPSLRNSLEILSVHKRLTDLFYRITAQEKRSLASKYLHFHFPHLFFLYDSRAAKTINKYIPPIKIVVKPSDHDKAYASHFFRCLHLTEGINDECGVRLTPRQLDNYLLGYG